ncbi:MAG TPA: hypothetical protein VKV21_17705 [Solirubrobacteraceae bacterium]|nr:hypothetical protein [Solirubrobacteraceae bacterium]
MTSARLHHRLRTLRRPLVAGLVAPAALAVCATQARADGESISIVQDDPTAVADQAVNFTASGALNPADTMFGFSIYVFAKDPSLDPTCAADLATEEAAAMGSNGNESWVSPSSGFYVGSSGTYSVPFKYTFSGPGPYLLCGYVDSDFSSVASGQLEGTVSAAAGSGTGTGTGTGTPPVTQPMPVAPAVVHAPWVTRRGHVLVCHAGRWSHSPSRLSYRWYASGRRRSIGSRRMLIERRALKGRHVRCRVTARNAAGARSASTRPVLVR